MYPNKVRCVGLGQGCVLKVVWKGFGRSIMMMKENFADLIFFRFFGQKRLNSATDEHHNNTIAYSYNAAMHLPYPEPTLPAEAGPLPWRFLALQPLVGCG